MHGDVNGNTVADFEIKLSQVTKVSAIDVILQKPVEGLAGEGLAGGFLAVLPACVRPDRVSPAGWRAGG